MMFGFANNSTPAKTKQDLPAHCCQDLQRELASIDIALDAAKNAKASLI